MPAKGTILYFEGNSENIKLDRRVPEAEGFAVVEAKYNAQALGQE